KLARSVSDVEDHDMTVDDPVVAQIQLGILLRQLREEADLTSAEAARRLGCSPGKMSRVENGKHGITADEVAELLEFYSASDAASTEAFKLSSIPKPRRRRRSSSYRDVIPNWFRRFLVLESEASDISIYDGETVTGLLQTEDYARVLLRAGAPLAGRQEIDKQVELRTTRQKVVTRSEPDPPQLHVILHESVLHRVIGGDSIMAAQLCRLLELSELPTIRLQVLPFRPKPTPNLDEALAARNAFTLLKLPERGTVLYLEDFSGATYPEDVTAIQQHADAFQRLRAAADHPVASRGLIARIVHQYQ
ncbi:MAG: helix-turn-helix domain-containing protein, partial [Candidatus Dormibacteraceae bacterium]